MYNPTPEAGITYSQACKLAFMASSVFKTFDPEIIRKLITTKRVIDELFLIMNCEDPAFCTSLGYFKDIFVLLLTDHNPHKELFV